MYSRPEDPIKRKKDEEHKRMMRELRKEVEDDIAKGINPEAEAEEKEKNEFPRNRHGEIIYDTLNTEESEDAFMEELIDEAVRVHNGTMEQFQIYDMERAANFITNLGNIRGNAFNEIKRQEEETKRYYKKKVRDEILVERSMSTGGKGILFQPIPTDRISIDQLLDSKEASQRAKDRADDTLKKIKTLKDVAKPQADQLIDKATPDTQPTTEMDDKSIIESGSDLVKGIPKEETYQLNAKPPADTQPSTGWDDKSVDQRGSDWVDRTYQEEPDNRNVTQSSNDFLDDKRVDELGSDWIDEMGQREPDQINSTSAAWDDKRVDERVSDWVDEMCQKEPDQLNSTPKWSINIGHLNSLAVAQKDESIINANQPIPPIVDIRKYESTDLDQKSKSVHIENKDDHEIKPVPKSDSKITDQKYDLKKEAKPMSTPTMSRQKDESIIDNVVVPIENTERLITNLPPKEHLVKYTMLIEKAKFETSIKVIKLDDIDGVQKKTGGMLTLTEKLDLTPNEKRALFAIQSLFGRAENGKRFLDPIPNPFANVENTPTLPTFYYKKSDFYEAFGIRKSKAKNQYESGSTKPARTALNSLSKKRVTYSIEYEDGVSYTVNNANLIYTDIYTRNVPDGKRTNRIQKFPKISLSSLLLLSEDKWYGKVQWDVYSRLDKLVGHRARARYYNLIDELKIKTGNLVNVKKSDFIDTITQERLLNITGLKRPWYQKGESYTLKKIETVLDNLVKVGILLSWTVSKAPTYTLIMNYDVFYWHRKKTLNLNNLVK
jgi:hypothetical protein